MPQDVSAVPHRGDGVVEGAGTENVGGCGEMLAGRMTPRVRKNTGGGG